jgi:fluoride exporter
MVKLFWICMAGALGTGARYLVGLWADQRLGKAVPYGTLLVNVAGCFLMALVMQVSLRTASISPALRLTLTVGFMGGLTTYSSFNYDLARYLQSGAYGTASLYFCLTVVLCLLASSLGVIVASSVFPGGLGLEGWPDSRP